MQGIARLCDVFITTAGRTPGVSPRFEAGTGAIIDGADEYAEQQQAAENAQRQDAATRRLADNIDGKGRIIAWHSRPSLAGHGRLREFPFA